MPGCSWITPAVTVRENTGGTLPGGTWEKTKPDFTKTFKHPTFINSSTNQANANLEIHVYFQRKSKFEFQLRRKRYRASLTFMFYKVGMLTL